MLELKNIVKDYVTGDTTVRALKGVDVTFRRSEFVSVLGPSGCGKTTLLNIVGGLDSYTCGDLIINGRSTRDFKAYDWDAYRNNCIGFVFQNYNLIPHLSVLGNVELALTLSGKSKSERRAKAAAALEKVGLGKQMNKRPNQLSGGQMQRVAIARAIVNDPEIILADEPTGALDSKNSVQIADLLKEISRDRLIIMVTHNDALAEEYSTRIIKFLDGEKVDDSNPYEPTQEERLQEIKYEREKRGEAFSAEEYAPDAYPDPYAPLTKKGKSEKDINRPQQSEISVLKEENETAPKLEKAAATQKKVLSKQEKAAIKAAEKARKDEKKKQEKQRKKEMKRTSMNFFTALGLSGRNLATKKGRTILVSFAGSIGIIGIALVLSISNGFTHYINKLQTDTLAGFPITIAPQAMDIESVTSSIGGNKEEREEFPSGDKVEIYTRDISTMVYYNDITDEYVNYVKAMPEEYYKAVSYTNSLDMLVLRKDGEEVKKVSLSKRTMMGSQQIWQEMLPNNSFMKEQYSVLAGKMPENKNELALIVDKYNRIDAEVLEALGITYETDDANKLSFNDILNLGEKEHFLAVSNDNAFPDGKFVDYDSLEGKEKLPEIYKTDGEEGKKNVPLKLVGILRTEKGVPLELFNSGIVYSPELTQEIISLNANSLIIAKQKEEFDKPSYSGYNLAQSKTFYELAGFSQAQAMGYAMLEAAIANLEQTQNKPFSDILRDDPELNCLNGTSYEPYKTQFKELAPNRDLIKNMLEAEKTAALEDLNYAARPSSIYIYPKDFETKKKINDYLNGWNNSHPNAKIMYTDASELLASTMGNMVDIISYVLIAFAAVSLVVSSIMIAIITYVSVIERTKEIGVLRSIGARKKDISRVFNAETVLIGLIAGVMGVLIAAILNFPINAILQVVINANGGGSLGIGNLAVLNPLHALLLITVSVVLTLISGFIPSRIAAKKDPVTALRTE